MVHSLFAPSPSNRSTVRVTALLACALITHVFANAPVVTSVIKPQKIVSSTSGGNRSWFIDFGPAHFGSLSFRLSNPGSAQSGQVVVSEAASATDIITNAIGARTATSTLSIANGTREYTSFTEQPIRACRIRVPEGGATLDTSSILLTAKHVPFEDGASAFTSSDTTLDRIYRFCKHTVKATSFRGVYIDGIREIKPYEGDAYINMLSHFAIDANPPIALFTHEYLLTHPTWPWEYRLISILIGWEIYMATGDIAQLERNYPVLTGRIQSCIGSGSWSDSLPLADWPVHMRDGLDSTRRGNVVTNSWVYKALMTIADMADALAKPTEASAFRARAAQTKKRLNDSLLIKDQGLYRDAMGTNHVSLHGNLYPLALGLVPDSLVKNVGQYLVKRGMVCNVYGAQFLLDGLFEAGFDSAAVAWMAARTGNSWGHMLYEVGASLTMETWDPSQKPNLDWNHAWATAPTNVIPRRLFGILPLTPGYSQFQVKPRVGNLTTGSYTLPTVKGTIGVAFQSVKGKSLSLTIDVPSGTFARVYLPLLELASTSLQVDNRAVPGTLSGAFLFVDSIPPGRHVISRGFTVGVRPVEPEAPGRVGVTMMPGRGRVRFYSDKSSGETSLTLLDFRGNRICAFSLGASEDRTLSLPPGVYVSVFNSPGRKSVPAKFMVR